MIQLNPIYKLSREELQKAVNSYTFRKKAAETLDGFCLVYLPHHFYMTPPDFQPEMMAHAGDHTIQYLLIQGFRGGGKSTVGALGLPLWAALTQSQRYPFIVPIADTATQAGINIANIKTELENNMLIKQDFGNIKGEFVEAWDLEGEEDWQAKNLLLSNGVRILARSRGQKVRGLKHRQYRPRLVPIDDPEDLKWVTTKENRDATEKWLRGEVLPGIDKRSGRVVILANRLHNDALVARLENDDLFTTLKYPVLRPGIESEWERCVWKANFPTPEALAKEKKAAGASGWMREYMLTPVPDEGQEVTEADITYYDSEPVETELGISGTALDLAISSKQTADKTAGVSGKTAEIDGHLRIYIQPHPIHGRFDLNTLKALVQARAAASPLEMFWIEDVAYQKAAILELQRVGLPVEGVPAIGDKRARLKIAATHIKNGTVLFPRHGAEELIQQLLNFGSDEHDDLVDALVYLILELVKAGARSFQAIGV